MLCDSCHQRPATCHIVTILDGVQQTRDLCSECHEANSPETRAFAAAMRNARCEYCGGETFADGTDFLEMVTGVQKLRFMCMPCSIEHNRYVQEQLQEGVSGLSQQDQLALLRRLAAEADKHMKEWVSERGLQ
jgi:hypothetical protein